METATLRIALTPGEPGGIGPDLCVLLARTAHASELVAVADPDLLLARARRLGVDLRLRPYDPAAAALAQAAGTLTVAALPLAAPVQCGQATRANARYVIDTIAFAAHECLDGRCAALVTGPVHKGIINDAGIPFSGHTEYLAEITGAAHPVMMLATPGLRVALATTHLPLAEVSAAITLDGLLHTLRVLDRDLRARMAIDRPRILVCGLNPHAGEGGHLGREEIDVIAPAIAQVRDEGIDARGPLPADTLFTPKHLETADVVLAMYHDQGLPVLKHMGFGNAVNISLGLPIVRTSVDHGTALDLAGTGDIEVGSLESALQTAVFMVRRSGPSPA